MSSFTPSRRGLITASAWTVPAVVLASSAPAFANSQEASSPSPMCAAITYVANWTSQNYNFQPSSASAPYGVGTGTVTATPAGGMVPTGMRTAVQPMVVTVTNAYMGNRVRGASAGDGAANMRVSPFNVGKRASRGLTLMQAYGSTTKLPGVRADHGQTLTLQFNRPVKGLKFTITDIDSSDGQYRDRVSVVPAPASFSKASQGLGGSGTTGAPWGQSSHRATYDPSRESDGNVTLTYGFGTDVSTVEIRFWNDQPDSLRANGLQGIFISDLEFTASAC